MLQRPLSRRIAVLAPIRSIGSAVQNTDHKLTVPRLVGGDGNDELVVYGSNLSSLHTGRALL